MVSTWGWNQSNKHNKFKPDEDIQLRGWAGLDERRVCETERGRQVGGKEMEIHDTVPAGVN